MKKGKSLKHTPWSKGDLASVIAVYAINAIILTAVFIGALFFKCKIVGTSFSDAFAVDSTFFGFVCFIAVCEVITAFYFYAEDKDFLRIASNSEMVFLAIEIALAVCVVIGESLSVYIRPVATVAILMLFLTNENFAIFLNFIFSVLVFLADIYLGLSFDGIKLESVYMFVASVASGTVATWCMRDVYSRLKLLVLGFTVSLPTLICTLIGTIGKDGKTVFLSADAGLFSGVLAVIVAIVLLPVFEFIFKKVTSFKLAELTDHKAKFIKKLITNAPGTFNHAIVVSNIAEVCATAIGEDALLARTCAYYHDIGKLRRPEFFKENQADGINPHDDLTAELSASIIKSHTSDGYSLVQKNGFPKEIAAVCREHHGTMPILYFYNKAKKFTDGEVDIAKYCYLGPKPQSKISAIIMIADGCEAAVRTLTDRSRDKVYEVVKKIVRDRMEWGQFDECEITLKELDIVIQTAVNSLTGVYHTRVEYPKINMKKLTAELEAEKEKDERKDG